MVLPGMFPAGLPVRNRKRKRISGYYRRQTDQSFDDEKPSEKQSRNRILCLE